jgi:DNA-binding CsgD family transcriptional regulator
MNTVHTLQGSGLPSSTFAALQGPPVDDADDAAEGAASGVFIRMLDELDYGLMLVTKAGTMRFANRIALRECETRRFLGLVGGDVHGRDDRSHGELRQAIVGATRGRRAMVSLRGGESVACIAVVPIADPKPAGEELALLVFGRQQVCEPLSVEFFAREHGLTMAETAVLRALCQGQAPAESARRLGVAVSTVRTHISSLRQKTGMRTIGDVVRAVTVLPPIVAVLN